MTSNKISILVAQLNEGKKEAFEQLFYVFYSRVFNLARRYYLSKDNSEDITQQVFIIIWEKRSSLDPEQSFEGYLLSTASKLIINYLKRKTYLQGFINYALYNNSNSDFITENLIAYKDLQNCLEYLIDQLPPRRKQIFKLSRNSGLSYKDIAQELSLTESTVNTQITKALEFLREKLKQYYS